MPVWTPRARSAARAGARRLRLLVIEDDPDVAALLALVFERDWDVEWASSALEARRALRRGPAPDVALLDLHLPDGDGTNVCREVKQTLPQVQVAVLAAYGHARTDALAAGADLFILKPFDPETLLASIGRLARPQRGSPAA